MQVNQVNGGKERVNDSGGSNFMYDLTICKQSRVQSKRSGKSGCKDSHQNVAITESICSSAVPMILPTIYPILLTWELITRSHS